MSQHLACLQILEGPNKGDSVSIRQGSCRLIGRHLSENETTLIDKNGHRVLDPAASHMLSKHLETVSQSTAETPKVVNVQKQATFQRGSDIILADDAVSRAHAMLFYDNNGIGIIDLASTNGTYVQDKRVSSALLQTKEQLSIGSSILLLNFVE